ncbi:MAG: hypothetical protein RLZ11_360, partial [Bacteroidota bacterium]
MRVSFQKIGFFLIGIILTGVFSPLAAQVTPDTTKPTSVDPRLIEWGNARVVKEYSIADVKITGIRYLDTSIVYSIANLQPGDKFVHPGAELFGKAISNLWRQKLFSGVQVFVTKIEGEKVWVEINIQERPRLGNYKFSGIRKSEEEDILTKISLTKQTIITENTRREIVEKITKHYAEKGFRNVTVKIEEKPDPAFANSNQLLINVNKGERVRIGDINFYGNQEVDDLRLKKQLKGTKEMTRITLRPDKSASPYGANTSANVREYFRSFGFLSPSRTKRILDPYFRFKLLSSAKFDDKKYEEDKEKVLNYYNSLGYRDAQIVADTQYLTSKGQMNVDFKINEGRRYYFG